MPATVPVGQTFAFQPRPTGLEMQIYVLDTNLMFLGRKNLKLALLIAQTKASHDNIRRSHRAGASYGQRFTLSPEPASQTVHAFQIFAGIGRCATHLTITCICKPLISEI